ncbi:MAG: SpoIIE family protein phosphatase, partial [Verrucomicrobiota bacterium]|nr:SpoIIE family protein phosphatase [Verrucomicrobiota bacterium]
LNGMARDLCFRSESLAAIFRCCAELGRTNDLEGFGQRLLSDLLHLTAADWFVLRLASPDQARLTVFAASAPELRAPPLALAGPDSTSAEATSALRHSEVRFEARTPEAREDPLREAGSDSTGLVHPLFFGEVLVGTLAVGRKTCSPEFSELQSEVIRTFAEFLAIQIASKRHQDEQVQSRLTARELDIARGIQRALLPKSLPQLRGFGLAGCCESARKVGGDFYDALPLSDHSLLLVMADVMGKGVPAAMFATILRSVVHAMSAQGSRPGALLAQLNRLLYPELSAVNMFITAQLVFLDLDQRQLVTASAGHCPALLVSSAGASVRAVTTNGLPLGILPEVTYRETTAMLEEPAIFLLHTDGLTESWNSSGEMFGQARLMSWLRDRGQRPHTAEQLRDALAAELGRFRGGAPLLDDQAFLILAEEKSSPHPHRAVSPRLAFWKNAPAKSSNPPQLVEP